MSLGELAVSRPATHAVRPRRDRARMHPVGTASPVHRRFHHEWQRLRHDPRALRRAARWRLVAGPLRDLDQLVARAQAPDAEPVLHALVAHAREDDLAARVLLQRLLPELVALHRRRSWQGRRDVEFGDLLASGWVVIRTYNHGRRPARLARSLVSDIDYREYRAAQRRIGHGRPADPIAFDAIADVPPADPTVELAHLVRDAGDRLSAADRDLVRRIVSGRTARTIADELRVTDRTVRNRRDRIAATLREVAAA